MKALSLLQTWAHAVMYYGKSLENRRWNTSFRGEFLIHAAKGMTRAEYGEAEGFVVNALGGGGESHAMDEIRRRFRLDFATRGRRGGFVGRARLVGVIPPCHQEGFGPCRRHPWHIPEQFGFQLEEIRAVPFVAYAGSLGFFNVPDAFAQQVSGERR